MLLLLIALLLPLLALVPLTFLGRRYAFSISIAAALLVFITVAVAAYVSIAMPSGFSLMSASFAYIPSLGIGLSLGLNAYTLVLALLTVIVFLAASLPVKNFVKESEKLYSALFLILLTSTLGVFFAGNFIALYVFWEISDFVMFFMIYIFGGYNRHYASLKFLIFSITSSLLLLIGILLLYSSLPQHTFDISYALANAKGISTNVQTLIVSLLLIAFAIKMPIFPLHTWQPDAYSEAPPPSAMVLSGVMSKFGGYGMLLLFMLLPLASHYSIYVAILFGFSALYMSIVTLRQANFKRVIAYASAADMGIVAMGISAANAYGYTGALYLMLSQGLVIALLFLIAGTLDESFGTPLIDKLRGVAKSMQGVAYSFLFAVFALGGIPLTAGFVAELILFTGVVNSLGIVFLLPLAAVLLISVFMFWLAERMFFNISKAIEPFRLNPKSVNYSMLLLSLSIVLFGVVPAVLIGPIATALL